MVFLALWPLLLFGSNPLIQYHVTQQHFFGGDEDEDFGEDTGSVTPIQSRTVFVPPLDRYLVSSFLNTVPCNHKDDDDY